MNKCETCKFYVAQYREWGHCHGDVPQIHATEYNNPHQYWSSWPSVARTMPGCRRYKRAWFRSLRVLDNLPETPKPETKDEDIHSNNGTPTETPHA